MDVARIRTPRRGLWRTYFLSFTATFLICSIVIVSSFYIYVESLLKEEMASSSINMANQVRDVMDVRVDELYHLAIQLSLDKRIRSLFNVSQPFGASDYISMNNIREVMAQHSAINKFVDYFIIYYPESGYVYTPMGNYTSDLFPTQALWYEDTDKNEIANMLDKFHHKEIVPLNKIEGHLINGNYITFIQSVPIEEKRPKANIFMFISEDTLLSMMGKTMPAEIGHVSILTKEGEMIASKNHEGILDADIIQRIRVSEEPFFIYENGDDKSMVAYAYSEVSNWYYITILNMNMMLDKVGQIRNRTFMIAVIGCAVGLILSVLMTKFTYSPWELLMQSLPNSVGKDQGNRDFDNEYIYIRDTIKGVLSEREGLKNAFEKSTGYARFYILQNLCEGKDVSKEDMQDHDIEFPYGFFRMLLIKSNANIENMYNAFPTIIARLENMNINGCHIQGYYDQRDFLCLIVNTEPQWKEKSAFNILIDSIKQVLGEYVPGHIFIGAGDFYDQIDMLPSSYQEARKALEYSFIEDEDLVMEYSNLPTNVYEHPEISLNLKEQLINCVRNADYISASNILDSIFSELSNHQNISKFDIYYLYYNLINVILEVCNERRIGLDEIWGMNVERIFNIDDKIDIEQIINNIYDIYEELCDYIEENDSGQVGLTRKIEEYIMNNFRDENITLAKMAEDLEVSSSYLSRYMSKNFGMGFGDYLNYMRIAEAKLLLANDSKPIYEIAEIIGYTNVNTFIRAFKRREAITPGQYRENILNE